MASLGIGRGLFCCAARPQRKISPSSPVQQSAAHYLVCIGVRITEEFAEKYHSQQGQGLIDHLRVLPRGIDTAVAQQGKAIAERLSTEAEVSSWTRYGGWNCGRSRCPQQHTQQPPMLGMWLCRRRRRCRMGRAHGEHLAQAAGEPIRHV